MNRGDAAQVHVFGGDVGDGVGGCEGQGIVARIGAAQTDLGDADPFAIGCVFIFEVRGLRKTQVVTRHDVAGAAAHAGVGQTVVHLVAGRVADGQALSRDVGGAGCAGVLQAVIARIGAP